MFTAVVASEENFSRQGDGGTTGRSLILCDYTEGEGESAKEKCFGKHLVLLLLLSFRRSKEALVPCEIVFLNVVFRDEREEMEVKSVTYQKAQKSHTSNRRPSFSQRPLNQPPSINYHHLPKPQAEDETEAQPGSARLAGLAAKLRTFLSSNRPIPANETIDQMDEPAPPP